MELFQDGHIYASPEAFYLLFLIPFLIWLYYRKTYRKRAALNLPTAESALSLPKTFRQRVFHLPFLLFLLGFTAAIFALARPRSSTDTQQIKTEGVDIVLSMDVSSSMLAEDLKPNRLEAAKEAAIRFISGFDDESEEGLEGEDEQVEDIGRQNDRIGLVVFAGESYSASPITIDHRVVLDLINELETGVIEDGTALGMGLATAVDRLKGSESKSKVVILLTDGVNNTGRIDPITASEIAQEFGVKVYTIGVGRNGTAPYPFKTRFGIKYQNVPVEIDEKALQTISENTNGRYFRATDAESLVDIYREIDQLEKTEIETFSFRKYSEHFPPFLIISIFLIVLSVLLKSTWLRSAI
jgi:Ca-activated chloride channel family protein